MASSLVASMEKEWNEQIFSVSSDKSVFTLFEHQTCSMPLLSEAGRFYVKMKGKAGDKRFERYTSRVVSEVIGLAGDKLISAYTRYDALAFRDALLERDLANATVKRNFECIRAIWNFAAREHGVGSTNPFSNMNYGNGVQPLKRKPIPVAELRSVQRVCIEIDDDIRWLIALISDTGMRLSEAAGLAVSDLHINAPIPFVRLVEHRWRRLKNASSQRDIPLIGASFWAAGRVIENASNEFAFSRYCLANQCKADSASNALNKWLKSFVPDGCVVHSFRHSFRDRLRNLGGSPELIDSIGGWKSHGVGRAYGSGYDLKAKHDLLRQICLNDSAF